MGTCAGRGAAGTFTQTVIKHFAERYRAGLQTKLFLYKQRPDSCRRWYVSLEVLVVAKIPYKLAENCSQDVLVHTHRAVCDTHDKAAQR